VLKLYYFLQILVWINKSINLKNLYSYKVILFLTLQWNQNLPDTISWTIRFNRNYFHFTIAFLYSPLKWEGDIFQKIYLSTTAFLKLKEGDKINVEHFCPIKTHLFTNYLISIILHSKTDRDSFVKNDQIRNQLFSKFEKIFYIYLLFDNKYFGFKNF
jgi:hypothetical protein